MFRFWFAVGCCAMFAEPCWAGMPSATLSDFGRLRLQNLSFFLVLFLLSALLIKLVWNYLGKDFSFLPRLTYFKALGVATLWGLLFVLVLTMISGARELMTPGAWEKDGVTYKLAQPKSDPATKAQAEADLDRKRRDQADRLRSALWEFSQRHDGKFPVAMTDPAIPADLWQSDDLPGVRYLYVGGEYEKEGKPLAFEPDLFGTQRYVILTNGQVRRMTSLQLEAVLGARKPDAPKEATP